ncbi:MAG: hypothetical protein KDB00_09635 [Planctomycetales bacterium]|nr:hypothetical protein [Planctomycetales bacterium]
MTRFFVFAITLTLLVLCCNQRHAWTDDPTVDAGKLAPPVTTPVKRVGPAATTTPQPQQMGMMMAPAPVATLPAERYPQYRVGYQRGDSKLQSMVDDGRIRFLIVDPNLVQRFGHPILVQANITVDGQPFSQLRKDRSAAMLTASKTISVTQSEQAETGSAETESAEKAEEEDNDAESEVDSASPLEEAQEEADQPDVAPATVPEYRLASGGEEMLRRYAAAVGEDLDETETGWLMTHWTEGPSLLVLQPYFQSFRVDQRPAFDVLDRNHDQVISPDELSQAAESLNRCDANRDDVVDVLEISRAAEAGRDLSQPTVARPPLMWLIGDLVGVRQDDPAVYNPVSSFDTDQNGHLSEEEITALTNKPSEIELDVEFVTGKIEDSTLSIVSIADELQADVHLAERVEGVDVVLGPTTINFCGVQDASGGKTATQVSMGAVVDGYPLLPGLDPNDDGRLTIRELRGISDRLIAVDQDGDQTITLTEASSPIRVSIGLGPLVHRELAGVRTIKRVDIPPSIAGPEWFVRMDRNKDNDLTRSEFPGTDEQFKSLDADSDQLVSAGEANEFEKQTNQTSE